MSAARCWASKHQSRDNIELADAIHEAAHAVTGVRLGRGVEEVSLLPPDDDGYRFGLCKYLDRVPTPAWVDTALAAYGAERLLLEALGIDLDDFEFSSCAIDFDLAHRLIAHLYPTASDTEREALYGASLARGCDRARAWWGQIAAVADALLESQVVSGDEVGSLCQAAA